MSPEDAELVARLLAREEAAFVELIDAYHGQLLRFALAFVPSRAVAEEVVQETWTAVLGALPRFSGRSSLKTWLFRILSNRAKTRGVRERRSVPFSALAAQDESEPAVDPSRFRRNGMWADAPPRRWEDQTPEKVLADRRAVEKLEAALGALPENQRLVLTLRDVDGLESHEVCNILEISETNQRVLLHRARSRLRAVLEEFVDRS